MNRAVPPPILRRVVLAVFLFFPGASLYPADYPGMVRVPGGKFTLRMEYSAGTLDVQVLDSLITDERGRRYSLTRVVDLPAFYIDRTEVTNKQFKQFLEATGYAPDRPDYFLKDWSGGSYPQGREDHPVVWVSLEDARAYARWAGKSLPTEEQWQKAAQGTDGRIWPWGNNYAPDKANMDSRDTRPVGSYPEGASPCGCLDMAGNVWEWVGEVRTDGYHLYAWIRGGSYFNAKESPWYFRGGPYATYQRTKLWLMAPGLNRCATVGFRCVKDAGR